MSVFSAAIDAIFADANMAADATWTARSGLSSLTCRVILKSPDAIEGFAQAQILSDTTLIDVRVSEIAAPAPGDRFAIGAETFVVMGKPSRDRERLVWTVEAAPA